MENVLNVIQENTMKLEVKQIVKHVKMVIMQTKKDQGIVQNVVKRVKHVIKQMDNVYHVSEDMG